MGFYPGPPVGIHIYQVPGRERQTIQVGDEGPGGRRHHPAVRPPQPEPGNLLQLSGPGLIPQQEIGHFEHGLLTLVENNDVHREIAPAVPVL